MKTQGPLAQRNLSYTGISSVREFLSLLGTVFSVLCKAFHAEKRSPGYCNKHLISYLIGSLSPWEFTAAPHDRHQAKKKSEHVRAHGTKYSSVKH